MSYKRGGPGFTVKKPKQSSDSEVYIKPVYQPLLSKAMLILIRAGSDSPWSNWVLRASLKGPMLMSLGEWLIRLSLCVCDQMVAGLCPSYMSVDL